MTTKKKAAPKAAPKADTKTDAALPTHDGTDTVDEAAQDGRAARMQTMAPDATTGSVGQTATASAPKKD